MSKPFAKYALSFVCCLSTGTAQADDVATDQGHGGGVRYEVALGFSSWSALADLQPVAEGSFDDIGYIFSGAVHWPFRSGENSELLLGIEAGLFPNESNIRFVNDNLLGRGLYLTPSLKWTPGALKRLSLDAGLGYYLVDIAEVTTDYSWYTETELWSDSALGGFVGGTWDFGSASRRHGAMLSLKAHFFDLGTVRDEDPLLPARLGPDAGDLSGPMIQLQLGYRWE